MTWTIRWTNPAEKTLRRLDVHVQRRVLDAVAQFGETGRGDLRQLTAREREVLSLIARGSTNPEIARELIITQHTVKVHVEHILAKLGVSDRTQAAVRAIELGYVSSLGAH